jgi:hypothetical protein
VAASSGIYPVTVIFVRKTTKENRNFMLTKINIKVWVQSLKSRAVLGGPANLTGGGIIPLVATTGVGEVLHFIKNWRTPNKDIGKVLCMGPISGRRIVPITQASSGINHILTRKDNPFFARISN